jgi:hypothetical protein
MPRIYGARSRHFAHGSAAGESNQTVGTSPAGANESLNLPEAFRAHACLATNRMLRKTEPMTYGLFGVALYYALPRTPTGRALECKGDLVPLRQAEL